MDTVARYQQQLLEQAREVYHQTPISDATVKAYLATPRHRFVRRYRERSKRDWYEVRDENLQEHLATLYADRSLTLFGEDDDAIPSTISQPSFVLRMLDLGLVRELACHEQRKRDLTPVRCGAIPISKRRSSPSMW